MNDLDGRMLDKPSIEGHLCAVCGTPCNNRHHVIQKGIGGVSAAVERRIPKVPLCGSGCTGHHGMVHAKRLHLRYENGEWQYLMTDEPTKYSDALEMGGWKRCRYQGKDNS